VSYHIPQSIRATACMLITLDELDRMYGVYYRGGRQYLIDYLEETQKGIRTEDMYLVEECASVAMVQKFTVFAYNQAHRDYISTYSYTHNRGYVLPEHKLIGVITSVSEQQMHAISMTVRSIYYTDTSKLCALIIPRKYAQ
jgi:hypothetical protein